MKRIAIVIAASCLLAGCGSKWERPSTSAAQAEADLKICDYQAELGTPSETPYSTASAVSQGINEGLRASRLRSLCMEARVPVMRRVILESPYAGMVDRNVAYARRAVRHSLSLGEAPIASHLLYTQPGILDDGVPRERDWGINAGHAWLRVCDAVVFYVDLGMSPGMDRAFQQVKALGLDYDMRNIGID